MTRAFDLSAIEEHGWRQGAVLGPALFVDARACAPAEVAISDADWLIVTSHDCDVVNDALAKEPFVELMRAEAVVRKSADKQQTGGRNPRALQVALKVSEGTLVLTLKVHERWTLRRELLVKEPPGRLLDDKTRRLIAEWLAKRYIRAAYPTAFDSRWRPNGKLKEWTGLLEKHSASIQGVYLRLSTLDELEISKPYRCHAIVGVPAKVRKEPGWAAKREQLDREVTAFWAQFSAAGITFDGVDVLGTDEITLDVLDLYQRFDADWVSFADDSAVTPPAADMRG